MHAVEQREGRLRAGQEHAQGRLFDGGGHRRDARDKLRADLKAAGEIEDKLEFDKPPKYFPFYEPLTLKQPRNERGAMYEHDILVRRRPPSAYQTKAPAKPADDKQAAANP